MLLLAGIGLYFVSTKARYKEIPPYNLFTYQTGSSEIATGEETIVATEKQTAEPMAEATSEPEAEEETDTPSEEKEFIYLSDINYLRATVGWSTVFFDKNNDNTPLNLKINGSNLEVKKGIWAHATSTVDYDISEYSEDYTHFITYYGISTKVANAGDGVKFYIYTSNDGEHWDLRTEENPQPMKSADNAVYCKIPLNGAKYLRLYAHQNGTTAQDNSVWGDCKLVKSTYQDNIMMTVEEFDEILRPTYQRGQIREDAVLPLLQREFIKNVGQYQLRCFVDEKPEHKETLEWFLRDEKALRLWTMGGPPNGSYLQSLRVLNNLYHAHGEDLEATGETANGVPYKDLYLRMMLSLSLSHSVNVSLWAGNNPPSNPVTRYEIYKQMHLDGLLANSRMFENFTVEEMRIVLFTNIDDEEIMWLHDYSKKFSSTVDRFNPFKYMDYVMPQYYNYYRPQYYSAENYDKWNQKYNLAKYNITYQSGVPKLWIVFEEGAVCGGLSKTAANLYGVWGYPAKVCGQPGHAAYIYLADAGGGRNAWRLSYNVVGGAWANTGSGGRIPNGWGHRYATNGGGIQNASYHFLAQDAQNEYDKYEKSELILLQENMYQDDRAKLENIYRDALEEEIINLDAWIGLVDLCITDPSATEEDVLELAEEIADVMKYHPLPMYDLTRRLETKLTTPQNRSRLMLLQENTLKNATHAPASATLYASEIKVVAEQLLGIKNPSLANFSFDGANAGKIMLSSQLRSAQVNWSYSLDGGSSWTDCYEHDAILTPEEIASITAEQDIKIHISGLPMTEANIYTIDITKRAFPGGVTMNDEEDRLYGATNEMEWTLDQSKGWNSFDGSNPIFEGEKVVYVRIVGTGTQLPSNPVVFTFHKNNSDDTKWYIKPKFLQIHEVNGTWSGDPNNLLDGNLNTYWRSTKGQLPAHVSVKLDQPRYISKLEFAPDKNAKYLNFIPYGRPSKADIYVSMDGETWELAATGTNLGDSDGLKTINFAEPKKALYVKFECTAIYSGDYTTLALSVLKLYENVVVNEKPRADVNYSITTPTCQDVTAELVNLIRPITVTNNNGSLTHTFTENGTFTFEFVDEDGNTGSATATVDWIDKTVPNAIVKFSTTEPTNQEVIATITFDKPNVTILSNNIQPTETGEYNITFEENTQYQLRFSDALGNIGTQTVGVDWIDKEPPTADLVYSTTHLTDQPVTVTLEPNEPITVTNNNHSLTHTFMKNGDFTFEIVDRAGNTNTITASVNWIAKMPEYTLTYSTQEWTTGNVTVTLEIEDGYTIISNGGSKVYTFTKNGEDGFEFRSPDGNTGRIPIRVDWIDREKPTAEVAFSTTNKTNQPVKATITPNEPVTVLSEGGLSHTFTQNGTFTFELEDRAGNRNTIPVTVDWIDMVKPNATLSYDKTEKTDTDVTVTITFDKPNVTVTNNNHATTYTFTKNGKFTFQFVDEAGNTNSITAEVTWIEKKEPVTPPEDITSSKYEIKDKKIRNVPLDLAVSEFRKNIQSTEKVILKDRNEKVLAENAKIGTGSKAYVGKNVYTFVVKADIDGNGSINLTDLAKICLHYIEDELLENEYFEAADLDDNKKISITDLAKIQLMLIESN